MTPICRNPNVKVPSKKLQCLKTHDSDLSVCMSGWFINILNRHRLWKLHCFFPITWLAWHEARNLRGKYKGQKYDDVWQGYNLLCLEFTWEKVQICTQFCALPWGNAIQDISQRQVLIWRMQKQTNRATTAAHHSPVRRNISFQRWPLIPAKQLKPVPLLHPIRGCLNSQGNLNTEGATYASSIKNKEKKNSSRLRTYLWPNNDQYVVHVLTVPLWRIQNENKNSLVEKGTHLSKAIKKSNYYSYMSQKVLL